MSIEAVDCLSVRSPAWTTNFTCFWMNCAFSCLMMSTATVFGFLPSSPVSVVHCVSAMTPNDQDLAEASWRGALAFAPAAAAGPATPASRAAPARTTPAETAILLSGLFTWCSSLSLPTSSRVRPDGTADLT